MENNSEQGQFRCTGDCLQCSRVQREYCGAQKGYDNQKLLVEMREQINNLTKRIEAMQSNDVAYNPNVADTITHIAQEGDGAEE